MLGDGASNEGQGESLMVQNSSPRTLDGVHRSVNAARTSARATVRVELSE